MQRKAMWLSVLAACLAPGSATAQDDPPAQQAALLRYRPLPGAVVHSLVWTDVSMTIADVSGGVGEAGVPDSITLEVAMRHSITERVRQAAEGRYLLERTLDSARLRMRALGGAWGERPVDALEGRAARVVVNSRLQTGDFQLVDGRQAPPLARDALRTPPPGYEISLPDEPVAPGQSWATELVFPFNNPIELEGAAGLLVKNAELVARAMVMLDSLVARPSDTLAYLRFSGNFLPLTMPASPETGRGPTDISGALAGRLIWSTGWNAYVSGAARAVIVVQMTPGGGAAGQPGTRMRFDSTNRFRVRP